MKKGQLVWENIYKWIIALVFAVVILVIVFSNKEIMVDLLDKIKDFLRFGS